MINVCSLMCETFPFCFVDSSQHTQGPLDGSLYATILKSPKSPERCPSTFPFPANSNNNNNGTLQTPVKPQRGSVPNLISPPPEFSNTKIEIVERYANGSAAFPSNTSTPIQQHQHHSHQPAYAGKELLHRSHSYTPAPHHHHTLPSNVSYEEIRIPSRSSVSREIVQQQRNTYSSSSGVSSHQSATTPRPSSSQSHYHDHRVVQQQPQRSLSRASNYTPNPGSYPPSSHQVRPIESYHYSSTVSTDNGNTVGPVPYTDGRESVRSPLTLSMDSGISSSGITNRKFFDVYIVFCNA